MSASFDIGISTRQMLREPGGLPPEAEKHGSVYIYVTAPETTLGFYPLLANPSMDPLWAKPLSSRKRTQRADRDDSPAAGSGR